MSPSTKEYLVIMGKQRSRKKGGPDRMICDA